MGMVCYKLQILILKINNSAASRRSMKQSFLALFMPQGKGNLILIRSKII